MNIYDLLNKIIKNKRFELSAQIFIQEDRDQLNENDKRLFDIFKNISSLGTEVSNSGIKFHPMFVMANGQRSFAIEDITDNDYKVLQTVDFNQLPLILRSLIADILWTQKKDFMTSKIAAESYWELFQLWYAEGDYLGTLDMIKRAVCISIQTKQKLLYSKIYVWLNDFLLNDIIDANVFFSLRIIELFAEQKGFDVTLVLPALDSIISFNDEDVYKKEQAYKLKTKCLYKLGKKEDVVRNNLSLAECYVNYAEQIVQKDIHNVLRAVSYYKEAISLYRNNGEPGLGERTHKRLVEIQKIIPRIMIPLSTELDIKDLLDNIKKNMEGLTFEESIIRLTQIIVFDSQETIRNRVIEEAKKYPLAKLFGKNLVNGHGQTIISLPPLDIQNPEKEPHLFELYMHQNEFTRQKMIGDIWIKEMLSIIRERFVIDGAMLDFLVRNNPIIPKGRERIFQNAIYMFLKGELYESMHILAPQMENLFRNIAKEVGGLTVTLENDGSSMEKVLSSIFTLPELLESYDNNILFIFKGLLNEQAGANIRNEIAHGIIEEETCYSGAYLYFGAAVIKLLTYTSVPCYKILKKSVKLKCFEIPNENGFKETKN